MITFEIWNTPMSAWMSEHELTVRKKINKQLKRIGVDTYEQDTKVINSLLPDWLLSEFDSMTSVFEVAGESRKLSICFQVPDGDTNRYRLAQQTGSQGKLTVSPSYVPDTWKIFLKVTSCDDDGYYEGRELELYIPWAYSSISGRDMSPLNVVAKWMVEKRESDLQERVEVLNEQHRSYQAEQRKNTKEQELAQLEALAKKYKKKLA